MKRTLFLSMLCTFTLIGLPSCTKNKDENHEYKPQEDEKVYKINYSSLTLSLESSFELIVSLNGVRVDASWSASNDSVMVYNGLVTGQKIGESVVTASIEGNELTCDVNVVSSTTIPSVQLNCNESLILENGDTYTVIPMLYWNSNLSEPDDVEFSVEGTSVTGELNDNRVELRATNTGNSRLVLTVFWHEIPLYTKVDIEVK